MTLEKRGVLPCFAAVLLGCAGVFVASPSAEAQSYLSAKTIVAFGDSITWGDETSSGGPATAYPKYLAGMLGSGHTVINAGHGGESVINGAKRIGSVLDYYRPNLMLIMEGVNDLWWKGSSFPYIDAWLDSMILQSQSRKAWVVLGTVTPATEPTLNSKFGSFNDTIIYSLAARRSVPVAEVYKTMTSRPGWQNLLMNNTATDPVHPNDAGERVIAEAFNAAIRNARVLSIVASPSAVSVPEGDAATFAVRLSTVPSAPVTVTVSRVSGDADLNVTAGSPLVFPPATATNFQTVTLAAAEDSDFANGAAAMACRAAGLAEVRVTATEADNDQPVALKRINCGGGAAGVFAADSNYNTGVVYKTTAFIKNATVTQAVYQCQRSAKSLVYTFGDIPNGDYTVRLHFAELICTAVKQRKFSMYIENVRLMGDYDVFLNAGGRYRALVKTFPVRVADGNGLEIIVYGKVNNAILNGIEVLTTSAAAGAGAPAPARSAALLGGGTALIRPVDVRTSGGQEPSTNGWNTVDGDTNTLWVGKEGADGWWCSLVYDPAIHVGGLSVDLAEGSLSNILALYSTDADHWFELAPALQKGPVSLNYLWLIVPADPAGGVPAIREIGIR